MEIVSFKVAKTIANAGYPQGPEDYAYRSNGEVYIFENMFDRIPDYCCDAPTYMEVWLWLWREKHIAVEADYSFANDDWFDGGICGGKFNDPEEAIIAAIEYLVDNDLIK